MRVFSRKTLMGHRSGPGPPAHLQPGAPAEPADRHRQATKADRAVGGTWRCSDGTPGQDSSQPQNQAQVSSGAEGCRNPEAPPLTGGVHQNGAEPWKGRAPHQHCPIHLGARKG
jgi:hypothetical protein